MASVYTDATSGGNILTTELNSLASASNKITTTEISNGDASEHRILGNFALSLAAQGTARDAGATVDLYLIPEVGGTFAYGGDSLDPASKHYVGSFEFDAATTARVDVLTNVSLPNTDFHVLVQNNTGQAFAASGNTLSWEYFNYEDA